MESQITKTLHPGPMMTDHRRDHHVAKAFVSDEKGSVLPIMAALMLIATAGAALAVDIARAYATRSELQSVADAAALAAAIALPDLDAARNAARRAVRKNLPGHPDLLQPEDFEFGYWQAESRSIIQADNSASAVRVTVRLDESRGNSLNALFAGVFGEEAINVATSAVAGKRSVSCLLALNPAGEGLELSGDVQLQLEACGAQVNASKNDALKVADDSTLISDGICVSGGASIGAKADVFPSPTEYCPPQADPMRDLVLPSVSPCVREEKEYKDETITLSDGHVFCEGFKVKGNSRIILKPGFYVIQNGKFEMDDTAVLEGDNVTIMLYGEKAEFDIKGKAALRLTAPTAGPRKGLLIVQNEGATKEKKQKDNKWDSESVSVLTGVVYLPDGKFTSKVVANITGTDSCFVLIASEVKIEGRANMLIDLSGTGCRNSLPTAFSRSVALLD